MLLCLVIHSDIMCCHKSNETQRAERERERDEERERESSIMMTQHLQDVWSTKMYES